MIKLAASRRQVLKTAAGAIAAGALPIAAHGQGARTSSAPNVIYIMADDLGFADLSCYGRRDYATPNIDRLAKEGLKFSQAYSNSAVCSATRMGLITGRYQYRLPAGLDEPLGFEKPGLPAGLPTMPEQFRRAGYHTILIGKWHLGTPPACGPLVSGYDRFFGFYGGGTDYWKYNEPIENFSRELTGLIDQDRMTEEQGYLTEVLGRKAIETIRQVPRNKPFFMSLHFTAPHWPWESPNDPTKGADVDTLSHFDGGSLQIYSEMVRSLDEQVGALLALLDQSGLADDTIVVFTSDNGGERFSDVWPLVGAKTELLEGGIRVPLLVRWPGRIVAGRVTEQTSMSMDALPTLLAAAGLEPDPSFPSDGENLLPVLLGAAPHARQLFWRYKALEQVAHRDGDWKYLKINGKEYLFDLAADQRERANLLRKQPERARAMKARFVEWNAEMLPYDILNSSHGISENNAWVDRP